MSCGTCSTSAQPTTRAGGTGPTASRLLWAQNVGAWYRRQRELGGRPEISLPAVAPPPTTAAGRGRPSRYVEPATLEQAARRIQVGLRELTGQDYGLEMRGAWRQPVQHPLYLTPRTGAGSRNFTRAELESLIEVCANLDLPVSAVDQVARIRMDTHKAVGPDGRDNLTWAEVARQVWSIQAARDLAGAVLADPQYGPLARSGETALYTTRTGDTPPTYEVTLAVLPAGETRHLYLNLGTDGAVQAKQLDYLEVSTAQAGLTMRRIEHEQQGLGHCPACGYVLPAFKCGICGHCGAPATQAVLGAGLTGPTAPGGTP